jgi:nitroimidazol reductase NimA-like FMN-containing flavoprotein (pyridoxamine 5'-phosphate oxidase superfamily)
MHTRGPWSEDRVRGYLEQSVVPLRLACADSSGWPVVLSLWYVFDDGALWCATPARSRAARWLAREPRCGFELAPNEPPYFGVRGRGRAELLPELGSRVLHRLVTRYLGSDSSELARWLLSRRAPETAIRLEPLHVASWDFSHRMREPFAEASCRAAR